MSPVASDRILPGERIFARYAYGPTSRGYCGPPEADAGERLLQVALGESPQVDVRSLAKRFSGAWPYQELLGRALGADPLDPVVVRGYWLGTGAAAGVDRERFGIDLLDRIAPQAGSYWAHLQGDLLPEAAPTHLFHVLGVYPWTRLLATGRPEPLEVLQACRISPAEVVAVQGERLVVATETLTYTSGRGLDLQPVTHEVDWLVDGKPFADGMAPGAHVALHWGFACDVLTAADADGLRLATRAQLEVTNPRLVKASAQNADHSVGAPNSTP
ncbi:MAG: DUF6390 family protein [Nostocoides sp.]